MIANINPDDGKFGTMRAICPLAWQRILTAMLRDYPEVLEARLAYCRKMPDDPDGTSLRLGIYLDAYLPESHLRELRLRFLRLIPEFREIQVRTEFASIRKAKGNKENAFDHRLPLTGILKDLRLRGAMLYNRDGILEKTRRSCRAA